MILEHEVLGRELLAVMRRMIELGINQGQSGNASVRLPEAVLITPTAVPAESLTLSDLVMLDFDGNRIDGRRQPSSEWRIHVDILKKRPDATAVLHAHPTFSTAIACHERDIPPFHYMVAAAGGDTIRCAPYAMFGTQELSDHVVQALEGRRACLLAHHGIVVIEQSLTRALGLAVEVETLSAMYLRACELGEPPNLTRDQMAEVIGAFGNYFR